MNSSTRQQTDSFKVKTRHKNDAVKRLYWALTYHERDTEITATPVIKLACYNLTRQNGENVNPFGAIASVVGDQSGPWTR